MCSLRTSTSWVGNSFGRPLLVPQSVDSAEELGAELASVVGGLMPTQYSPSLESAAAFVATDWNLL